MFPAVVLLPLRRGVRRFSKSSRPDPLRACFVASCQLPRPNSRRDRSASEDYQETRRAQHAVRRDTADLAISTPIASAHKVSRLILKLSCFGHFVNCQMLVGVDGG